MALGLYIHIPFCIKKCGYCDFVSYPDSYSYHKSYIDAVIKEIKSYHGKKIDTIFIGGGTPTSIDICLLEKLINCCYDNLIISDNAEITIEANPGTVTKESLSRLKSAGVNRISFGVQSMIDLELKALGRLHTADQANNAFCLARCAGFENINLDIMFGIPYQTANSFKETLNSVISLSPEHISTYSLIIEENTPFYNRFTNNKLELPDEDTERFIYDMAVETLLNNGYFQYEISNFAKKGFKCRHNLKYWNCEEYIGVGLAAHSYLDSVRYANTTDLKDYIKTAGTKDTVFEKNILKKSDLEIEFIITGLRMCKGIELNTYKSKFGFDFYKKYKNILDKYIKYEFIEIKNGYCRLTRKGIGVSNSILCEFV